MSGLRLAFEAIPRALDDNGDPVSGARLYLYEAGTTTPVTTYSDRALTVANGDYITAASDGFFPQVYVRGGESLKARVTDANGALIAEADYVGQGEAITGLVEAGAGDTAFDYWDNPTGYQVTLSGVNYFINQDRHNIDASTFLVESDTDDATTAAQNDLNLLRVCDWMYYQGGGYMFFPGNGRVPLNRPIPTRSGIKFDFRGQDLENFLTADVAGEAFSRCVLGYGSFATQDDNDYDWTGCDGVSAGADRIRAADGSTDWTTVGREILIVNATNDNAPANYFGDGQAGNEVGEYNQVRVRNVIRIDGEYIVLDQPLDLAYAAAAGTPKVSSPGASGLYVTDASYASSNTTARRAGLPNQMPRHVVSDVQVLGGKFRAESGTWMLRTGVYRCDMSGVKARASSSAYPKHALGGNMFQDSTFSNISAPGYVRHLEVAGYSRNSSFDQIRTFQQKGSGVAPTQEDQVRVCGEDSSSIRVTNSTFNLGDLPSPKVAVKFSGGSNCEFSGNTVIGNGVSSFVAIADGNDDNMVSNNTLIGSGSTGISIKGARNIVRDNKVQATVSSKKIRIDEEADGCHITGNDVYGGRIRFAAEPDSGNAYSVVCANIRALIEMPSGTGGATFDNMREEWANVSGTARKWSESDVNNVPASAVQAISGITNADPAAVTATGHGRSTGDIVMISDVTGMAGPSGYSFINGVVAKITVIDANSFSLDGVDSTSFGSYTSGGVVCDAVEIHDPLVIDDADLEEEMSFEFSLSGLKTSVDGAGALTMYVCSDDNDDGTSGDSGNDVRHRVISHTFADGVQSVHFSAKLRATRSNWAQVDVEASVCPNDETAAQRSSTATVNVGTHPMRVEFWAAGTHATTGIEMKRANIWATYPGYRSFVG